MELAVHAEPVFVHVPVEESVSVADVAVATESWMLEVNGALPKKRNVRVDVMSSVVMPVSSAPRRLGVVAAGSAYRTTTIPEPPAPPA